MSENTADLKYLVWFVLCLTFSVATVAQTSLSAEFMAEKIESAKGDEKVEAIIDYIAQHSHFHTAQSIAYGQIGLSLLAKNPNDDLSARLLSHLARAHISKRELSQAKKLSERAYILAVQSRIEANQILSKLVSADVATRQQNVALAEGDLALVMQLSTKIGHDRYLARAHQISGTLNIQRMRFDDALADFLRSLNLYRKLQDNYRASSIHQSLASLYRRMNLYEKVLFRQNKAIQIATELDDERKLAIYYSNMGTYFEEIDDYDNAIEMHLKSLEYKQALNYQVGMIHTYNRLGSAYRLVEDYSNAESSLMEAERLKQEINRFDTNISTYLDLGRLYIDTGELKKAEDYLNKSLPLYLGSPWEDRIAEIYQAFAQLSLQRGEANQAIEHYLRAIEIAHRHQRDTLVLQYHRELAQVYERVGQTQEALRSLNAYLLRQAEWEDRNNQYRLSALSVEFDVEEKEREIADLVQENRIKDLEIEKQAFQKGAVLIALVLAFGTVFFLYFWYSKNKQLKVEQLALQQVSDAKERLRLALWGSGDELWDWDLAAGVITRDNRLGNLQLPDAQIGSDLGTLRACVHPEDYPRLQEAFNRHLNGESDYYEVSYRVKDKQGNWLWVLDRGKATARDEAGNAIRACGTIKDISELKATELALAELNKSLEKRVEERTERLQQSANELANTLEALTETQSTLVEAQKMASLGRLVSGVSHELNTPLGTAITASSVLTQSLRSFKEQLDSSKLTLSDTQAFIDVAESSAQLVDSNTARAAQLVKRFKQASAQEYISSNDPIELKSFIEAFLAYRIKESKVKVELDCHDPINIFSNGQALEKILEDLLANAIEHGFDTAEGRILIQVRQQQEMITILFSDNGKGIDKAELAQIFEPFHTTARHKGSVGLGLYMVFNLVTYVLNGNIQCKPNVPQGCTFELVFPTKLG
ncbi:tetratricopeptide repeat protein [Pseudoalteromonas sp. DL2-H2.2]|uniref:tetratricopeptide repeat protein n=1 Tax=Pseudoalteromonas sp. DL2-H2.2 TaxID=2908889 RepID=UPI001F1F3129|nr:tetratricopeptide repeat protein [Pseudoalteromonas sp. DL2-H2.2]MCF2909198.1 tetratricopeptide repeat protein [Pseudoalteromonas sp. DL2-H2.2]